MIYIILVILLVVASLVPTKKNKNLDWMVGHSYHRGKYQSDQSIGENSLEAIQLAVDDQVDIEIDVRITSDQELVVFHDANLKRMCGVDLNIESLSLDQLKEYPLKDSGSKIPGFVEMLEVVDGKIGLIIEIKPTQHIQAVSDKLMFQLKDYHGNYAICSFDPFILNYFKEHYPHVIRGQIIFNFFKNKDLVWWKQILLNINGFNIMSRSDYISVHYSMVKYFSWMRWFKAFIVSWTISQKYVADDVKRKVDHMIIEHLEHV